VEELFPYPALICHAEMLPVRSAGCIVACRAGDTCASAVEWRREGCELCGPDRLVPASALCNFKETNTISIDTPHFVLNTGQTRTIAEARVEEARSEVFRVTRSCALIHHIHTDTHKHTNHPRCQSASGCCARATPLRDVYTVGTSHYHAHITESK